MATVVTATKKAKAILICNLGKAGTPNEVRYSSVIFHLMAPGTTLRQQGINYF